MSTGFAVMILYFMFSCFFSEILKTLWEIKVNQSSRDQCDNHPQITIPFYTSKFLSHPQEYTIISMTYSVNRIQKWMGLGEWIRIGLCKIRGSQVAHSYDNLHWMNTTASLLHLAAGFLPCNVTENGMVISSLWYEDKG